MKRIGRRGKLKFFISILTLGCLLAGVAASNHAEGELHAAGTFPAPSFSLYEKVRLGSNTFTVIEQGANIKMLSDTASSANQTWANAQSSLSGYSSGFGALGNTFVSGKVKQPSYADLASVRIGTSLHASIPKIGVDWWLSDSDTTTNRSKFVDANNSFNKAVTFPKVTNTNNTCGISNTTEYGVKATTTQKEADKYITTSNNGSIRVSGTVEPQAYTQGRMYAYPDTACAVTNGLINGYIDSEKRGSDDKNYVFFSNNEITSIQYGYSIPYVYLYEQGLIGKALGNTWSTGAIGQNVCMTLKKPLYVIDTKKTIQSFKIWRSSGTNVALPYKVSVIDVSGMTTATETCKGQTHTAGTSSVRPMLTLPTSSIAFANTAKRAYTVGSHISNAFPSHDAGTNKPYLTLLSPSLSVGLTAGQAGVNGNTYTVDMPSDNRLRLPVTIGGTSEGTKYVSASAIINGVKKYGVLNQISGTTGIVEIDLADFASDPKTLSSITLTLYQENSGSFQTAYIGNGTDITVNLIQIEPQEITFDGNQPTSAVYGDTLSISASLTTNVNKQSNADLVFSIKSGDARIVGQSYNSDNGKATATISPTSGTGNIVIAINKAGDENASPAGEQTYTIALTKKAIIIKPVKPSKIYSLGEEMPFIGSTSDGLVNGDTIDAVIKPDFISSDGSNIQPDAGGKIAQTGTWRLVYPTDIQTRLSTVFTNKYDVSFIDWNGDSTLLFETAIADIPAGWIIVEPDANANGWNKDSVTIRPSAEAIQAGYDTIEVLNDAKLGQSITYDAETDGVTPNIRLKKGNIASNPMDIREIKIDCTAPNATVSIENETTWASMKKKVTITTTNDRSGILSVEVVRDGSAKYTTIEQAGGYIFDADAIGTYTITITDKAGNVKTITKTIEKIDTSTVSITAEKQAQTASESQDIKITSDGGLAGVKALQVFFQTDGGEFTFLKDLDISVNPLVFTAEMNGVYRFVLTTNAGVEKKAEVTIVGLTPPLPDTQITAVYKKDPTVAYTSNTWTNQDIILNISNVNAELVGAEITWEISHDKGQTWEALQTGNRMEVSTNTELQVTYMLKATAVKNGNIFEEAVPESFTVKIDKTDPAKPSLKDAELYHEDAWYPEDVHLEALFQTKANGIQEDVYACEGTKFACENTPSLWKKTSQGNYTVTGDGTHELYFQVIDEAGNKGLISDGVLVNINGTQPVITIKLNKNPIKEFLNGITFGYFFKDTVTVDVDVDFGPAGAKGSVYIIIDEEGGEMPEIADDWGEVRSSTSIQPNTKAMIYVKAVSDTGKSTRDSSNYDVYADNVPPVITAQNHTTWINEKQVEIEVTDSLSGLNPDSLTFQMPNTNAQKFSVINGLGVLQNLQEGEYDITIEAFDRSTNFASRELHVMIDTMAPSIEEEMVQPSGWADKKTITLSVKDVTSGLQRVEILDKDGIVIPHTIDENGNYQFEIVRNGRYTCHAVDNAGNQSEHIYEELYIDTIPPIISDKMIDKESDYTSSKQVAFRVQDGDSGVVSVVVSYEEDGQTKTVSLRGPDASGSYQFSANRNGSYTILATDHAGNTSNDTIDVENIDPNGIKIVNISDTQSWVKDRMIVSFEIQAGLSTLASGYPIVKRNGEIISVTPHMQGYQFQADENALYTIEAENTGGDHVMETIDIQHIDFLSPSITDISENTTSPTWRKPQTIRFHVYDYNIQEQTAFGSGLKQGYPKVYYLSQGKRVDVTCKQDVSDPTAFQFLADKNVVYIVEAMDDVEHPLVSQEIPVDHIMDDTLQQELQVFAQSDEKEISSGTWVNKDITFTLSGGVDASVLEGYEYAVTDGEIPLNEDWQTISDPASSQHKVSDNQKGRVYWFRALPIFDEASISQPFVVNLDKLPPENVQITKTIKQPAFFDQIMDAITFGSWMKEAQVITFHAQDNFTNEQEMKYVYAEEVDGIIGNWKEYEPTLSYEEANIILHVKAVDLAGNMSDEESEAIQIDHEPPIITGVKADTVYKQYYIPRFVKVHDSGSGLASAWYTKDGGEKQLLQEDSIEKIKGEGVYQITAQDYAENEIIVNFKIVSLPSIETEIDGSDKNKVIINQIQEELKDTRGQLTPDEITDYEKWIEDATKKWNSMRNKVVETTDKTAKVEGQEDTTFDPETILIVEPIDEMEMPVLPRKAIYNYNVYLKKGKFQVQPDGRVKVYLPYTEEEEPIVYQVDDENIVREIPVSREDDYVTFITNQLVRYAISSTKQEENNGGSDKDICVVGPDGKVDTNDDVCGKANGEGEEPSKRPDGSVEVPDGGGVIFPDGEEIILPDGGIIKPDGGVVLPDGTEYNPDGDKIKDPTQNPDSDDGEDPTPDKDDMQVCVMGPDGKQPSRDDVCGKPNEKGDEAIKQPDGSVEIPEGGKVIFPNGEEIVLPDGGIIKPDGSVVLPDGTEYDPDGNKKEEPIKKCTLEEKKEINIDTDNDDIPDLNLDINKDCKPELNIDVDEDGIPDIDIDSTGDGKPNVNVDVNKDGKADINIVLHLEWKPNVTYTVQGFTYNSMKDLSPDLNIDEDGDGTADRNVDTTGDGLPDMNVDADWWTKHNMKQPSSVKGNYDKNIGGAFTGENMKWMIWFISLILTSITMLYTFMKRRKSQY